MAFTYSRLTEITTIAASSAAALYTVASSVVPYIRLIVLHNGNSTAETVKLYNVPNGSGAAGSAAVANLFYQEALPAHETRFLEFSPPGMVLEDNYDTIQGITSTAAKVTFQMYGGKE